MGEEAGRGMGADVTGRGVGGMEGGSMSKGDWGSEMEQWMRGKGFLEWEWVLTSAHPPSSTTKTVDVPAGQSAGGSGQ